MLTKEDLQKLRRSRNLKSIFKKYDVKLAYLYGSQLTKYVRPSSDYDIAVLFKKEMSPDKYFDIRIKLMVDLTRYFKRDADVVVLQQIPMLLRYVATAEGKYIYEEKKDEHIFYSVKILREFADFLPFLQSYNKKVLYS